MLVQVAAAAGSSTQKAADAFLREIYQGAADAGLNIAGVSKVNRIGESVNEAGDTATLFVRIGRDGSVLPPRGTGDEAATSILQIDVLPDRVPGPDGQLHTRWVAYAKQYDTATAKLIESHRSGPSTDEWREWEAERPDHAAYNDPEFRRRVLDAMPTEPGEAVRQALAPLVGDVNRLVRGGLESSLATMDRGILPEDEDLPGLEPDDPDDPEWGDAGFALNITPPNGAIATVYGPVQPGDVEAGIDYTITPPPGSTEPPTAQGVGLDPQPEPSPDSGPRALRFVVMAMVAVVFLVVAGLVLWGGGGDDAGAPVAVEPTASPPPSAEASSGEGSAGEPADEGAAEVGLCPGDGTHGFTDTPIVFSSPDLPAGPLPEPYRYDPKKADYPTPAFRWNAVPEEAERLGIVMTWLVNEPTDRNVDPWKDGKVEGRSMWIVSGIDPAADGLPPSALATPLPDGVVEHRHSGGQVQLPDGTLSDRVLYGPRESDIGTADGRQYAGPFLFTVFAYCTPLGPDAVDAANVDVELLRRSIARGWFYVDNPWA
ncbi:MAG TPA: hypothetical protein ENK19_04195 [Acidobacteria bacterium]|nr:hypothetical protein [Acidobacteriota bacterium]